MKVRNMAKKVLRAVNAHKVDLDSIVDSASVWGIPNGTALYMLDQVITRASSQSDWEVVIKGACYGAGGYALYKLNKLLIPRAFSIFKKDREKVSKEGTIQSWIRTGVFLTLAGVLLYTPNLPRTMGNFGTDAQKAINYAAKIIDPKKEEIVSANNDFIYSLPSVPAAVAGARSIPAPTPQVQSIRYNTGALRGINLGENFASIVGIKGIAPEFVEVDFRKLLNDLWDSKLNEYRTVNGPAIIDFKNKNVSGYVNGSVSPTKMSLEEYIKLVDNSVTHVKENIDWSEVKKLTGLESKRLEVLKKIASSINGRDITAYAMTELMPSMDGDLNKASFEFLLKNAGVEYIYLYPSLGDGYISYGPFQFTRHAVSDPQPNGSIGGASIINRALPIKYRIPNQVYDLKGEDHHKSAFLFSVYNLALLMREINDKQLAMVEQAITDKKPELLKYIAAAHTQPTFAREAAGRWLNNGMASDYNVSASLPILSYAQKTMANYIALNRN